MTKVDFESEEAQNLLLPQDIVSLQHMHGDIKMQSLLLKLNKLKETGIEPDSLNKGLIKLSFSTSSQMDPSIFQEEDDYEEIDSDEENQPMRPW